MERNGSRSLWDEHKGVPVGLTRRNFIQRVSLTTLGVCAAVTGSSRVAAYAGVRRHKTGAVRPDSCAISCSLPECKGSACRGDLYQCTGCGRNFKQCIKGTKCKGSVCLAPTCSGQRW
jgi:hypothetical protein